MIDSGLLFWATLYLCQKAQKHNMSITCSAQDSAGHIGADHCPKYIKLTKKKSPRPDELVHEIKIDS